ncbi:Sarcosine oxidase gamma subunit [Candidatus Burkholderia verschuerenii]|uniref:Sarcosine oxidase gamma subunit n=1 Tax=Candidatus Burkholderia verschuerenii TaxID=242163 RepID=A0A0L0MCW1_9BURK|nr:sarcosine oxidase subunit gamma [Candidatus Burkholderia verschuerenii]KND60085.1 Sarcosine oxidase gamma subunit [Candidatus Burkholderia verschuerenii]
MLNEIKGSSTVVDRAISGQGLSGTWQESPLVGADALMKSHQSGSPKAFRLTERPFLQLVNERGDTRDPAFVKAIQNVIGCVPPEKANTIARGNGYTMLWLGPDEWLVQSDAAHDASRAAPLEATLRDAFVGQFSAAVDIGSSYTVLDIDGPKTREVLSRGCPLDLHPKVFAEGQCAQNHYFKASMTLVPLGGDRFELVIRRSFADYFVKIMLDAAEPLIA